MPDFSVSFDPESLEKLVKLEGFAALLTPEIQTVLTEAGEMLVTTARANTWSAFASPTGELADSIYFYVVSPTEVDLAVGVPYGRRRELGFSGMTDSLGRYFPNDPAKPYLAPAVESDRDLIRERLKLAVLSAWEGL